MFNNSQVSPLSGYSNAGTMECMYIGMATNYMKIYLSFTGRLKSSVYTPKFGFILLLSRILNRWDRTHVICVVVSKLILLNLLLLSPSLGPCLAQIYVTYELV